MERIWVNSAVTSCGTTESIELSRLIKETVRISGSGTEGAMAVEDEKHVRGNYFISGNKNKLYPATTRAPRRNATRRLKGPRRGPKLPDGDSWA